LLVAQDKNFFNIPILQSDNGDQAPTPQAFLTIEDPSTGMHEHRATTIAVDIVQNSTATAAGDHPAVYIRRSSYFKNRRVQARVIQRFLGQ
jgi:hypothetical protein